MTIGTTVLRVGPVIARLLFLLFAVLLVQHEAFAQAKSRPASAADFIGVFQLLPYPEEKQSKILHENPWPGPCQFFGHYPGGYWLHYAAEVQPTACKSAIPARPPALRQTVTWRQIRAGFFEIDRADSKVREVWKVDRINSATDADGIELSEGDIIMQLIDSRGQQLIWIRLLRKIGDLSN